MKTREHIFGNNNNNTFTSLVSLQVTSVYLQVFLFTGNYFAILNWPIHDHMKIILPTLLLFLSVLCYGQSQVISLYDGPAPGSENWTNSPGTGDNNGTPIEYNIVEPTLTVYPAQGAINTGTSVIIAPGGGYFILAVEHEGSEVAKYLSERGVTAFVLRYRVKQISKYPDDLRAAFSDMSTLPEKTAEVMKMAGDDGKKAVEYVRTHADELGLNPNRIGFMGFSAGGGVTMSVALESNGQNAPNFIAPIYPYVPPYLSEAPVPENMPAFIVVASDDPLQLAPVSVTIYNRWLNAGNPAELHVFAEGGHGFGTNEQQLPSDGWLDRFEEWLASRNLLWPENPTGWAASTTYQGRKAWLDKQAELMQTDWANLQRFAADNEALDSSPENEKRVVFMGNSITEGWINQRPEFFQGKPWINRGIGGQTTPQMLGRFRQDVIDLNPSVVVILAGTNDIAGNTGPMSLEDTFGNLVSMTELARANDIKVVLSSVLPAYDYPWSPGLKPNEKIPALNEMIREYAMENDIVYLDYFSPMANEKNGMRDELGSDGVHPNARGYAIMEPLAEAAIQQALKD